MADAKPNPAVQVLTQLKELWGKQSKKRKTIAVATVLGIAAIVAVGQFAKRGESWMVIAEASPDDAQELSSLLSSRAIPVRLRDGKVEVDGAKADEARAIASAAGLPHSGKGFELFDGSSLGQSSFTEQINYRRALQGELARSITAFAQVQSARVQVALGKRSVFKDQDEPASASIALHLHPGQSLTSDQVRGVQGLVAASIEGLKPEAVVVVDQHSNLLDSSPHGTGDRKAELEQTLTTRVRTMLERVVGAGRVSVVTTAVVDDRQVTETEETFDQTHPVLRSESRTVDGEAAVAGVGGVAGTRGNLPGAAAASPTPGQTNNRLSETKNYEVNRTVRQLKKPEIQLQKLHVAIVVDHKDGPDGKPMARTEKELAELTALARQAAGIDDARGDKIEVRDIQFAADPEAAPVAVAASPLDDLPLVPIAIGGGALVFLTVMVVILRARKKAKAKQKEIDKPINVAYPTPIAELERVIEARAAAVAASTLPPPDEVPALPPGKPVRERVLEVVRNDSERAAEVLTAWLSETVAARGAAK